jgi:hypothetical protein
MVTGFKKEDFSAMVAHAYDRYDMSAVFRF